MTRAIEDWRALDAGDFIILGNYFAGENASDHNVWVADYGFLTDHIPVAQRRDLASHWDMQYEHDTAFGAWQPRHGPVELVYQLSARTRNATSDFTVFNLGGGLGGLTVDLARVPGVRVIHVDISRQGNAVARRKIAGSGLGDKTEVVTADHEEFLRAAIAEGMQPDFIFFYGSLSNDLPLLRQVEDLLVLATQALSPGAYLWYVGLQEPFLAGRGVRAATDVLGEYTVPPGIITSLVEQQPGMYLVREEAGARPDRHPLVPGGEPVDHLHIVHRALYAKDIGGVRFDTPRFGFKDSVLPDWPRIWTSMVADGSADAYPPR
jgi:hypothetical protein